MAGGHDEGHPWTWLIIGVLIILLAYYFAHILPENPNAATIPGTQVAIDTQSPAQDQGQALDRSAEEIAAVSQAMLGTWQSTDDPKFTRQFNDDGTVIDLYAGQPAATAHGTWDAFMSTAPDTEFSGTLAPGIVYIKLVEGGQPMFFSIVTAAGDTLQMTYLDRGSQLNFTRI